MNDSLIRTALDLIQHSPTDQTLRAGLLGAGYAPADVDWHLEHMLEERLVAVYSAVNQASIWRLKLRGKELLDQASRVPIGFHL